MSWQAYADQITGQGIAHAGLYSIDNGAEWAKSSKNKGTSSEILEILKHMNAQSTSQINYNGQSFITLRNDGNVLYGKKGSDGITCAKSGKALVVGVYNKNSQPGQCNNAVENLSNYLTENGY